MVYILDWGRSGVVRFISICLGLPSSLPKIFNFPEKSFCDFQNVNPFNQLFQRIMEYGIFGEG